MSTKDTIFSASWCAARRCLRYYLCHAISSFLIYINWKMVRDGVVHSVCLFNSSIRLAFALCVYFHPQPFSLNDTQSVSRRKQTYVLLTYILSAFYLLTIILGLISNATANSKIFFIVNCRRGRGDYHCCCLYGLRRRSRQKVISIREIPFHRQWIRHINNNEDNDDRKKWGRQPRYTEHGLVLVWGLFSSKLSSKCTTGSNGNAL